MNKKLSNRWALDIALGGHPPFNDDMNPLQCELLPRSFSALEEVLNTLKDYPDIELKYKSRVEIEEKAPQRTIGSSTFAKRAKSVRMWLINRGIAPPRLIAKGYGRASASTEVAGITRSTSGSNFSESNNAPSLHLCLRSV